jgi:hypothetical protein
LATAQTYCACELKYLGVFAVRSETVWVMDQGPGDVFDEKPPELKISCYFLFNLEEDLHPSD